MRGKFRLFLLVNTMPKTAEQEKLEGYPGHRPVNKKAPVADRDIPPPPKWMGHISTRAYHDFVRLVGNEGMRVMAKSDKLALSLVCEAFEEWRKCKKILDEEGRYTDGRRHPALVDMQKWWSLLMTGLGKFGMTPYERQKVSTIGEPKKEKTREELMAEKRQSALEAAKAKQHIKAVNE